MEIIPFRDDTQFREEIELNQVTYILAFKWNSLNEYWSMDIFDRNLEPIAYGIKVVTQYNLTKQIVQSGMPDGQILCQNITGGFLKIERNDLGRNVELIFYTNEELA